MTASAVVVVVGSVILFETDKMLDGDASLGPRIADLSLFCLPSVALASGSPEAAKRLVIRQDAHAR
jgi:hypothetical protein